MKLPIIVVYFLMTCLLACDFEPKEQQLKAIDSYKEVNRLVTKMMQEADTVLLVSHTGILFDSIKHEEIFPSLLINNKINRTIIHEQKVITGTSLNSLSQIILIPTNKTEIVLTKCFDPHHTIFIIKKDKISYIDICFECLGLTTSDDLKQLEGFNESKFLALMYYYKSIGFKYRLK